MSHPQRTLAVDIGNTRLKIGIFSGMDLEETADFPADERVPEAVATFLERMGQPDRCIISSVVPGLTDVVADTITERGGVAVVRARDCVRNLIPLQVQRPEQVGTDRIVNCLAALRLHGAPSIVVSLGTATTFEILSGDGAYLGGCIVPGVGVSKDALAQTAALLPPYRWCKTRQLVGKTTLQHLEIGLYQGTKCLVEGMIAAYRHEIGSQAITIGTGGYGQLLAEDGVFDVYDPHLSLRGLLLAVETTSILTQP